MSWSVKPEGAPKIPKGHNTGPQDQQWRRALRTAEERRLQREEEAQCREVWDEGVADDSKSR